jgi:hypothetical protein
LLITTHKESKAPSSTKQSVQKNVEPRIKFCEQHWAKNEREAQDENSGCKLEPGNFDAPDIFYTKSFVSR